MWENFPESFRPYPSHLNNRNVSWDFFSPTEKKNAYNCSPSKWNGNTLQVNVSFPKEFLSWQDKMACIRPTKKRGKTAIYTHIVFLPTLMSELIDQSILFESPSFSYLIPSLHTYFNSMSRFIRRKPREWENNRKSWEKYTSTLINLRNIPILWNME